MARTATPGTRYVALLRAVNVGGNSIVSMAALAETFRRLGFDDVRTFLNSGNVIFSTPATSEAHLSARIESAITKDIGSPVRVLVLSAAAMRSIAAAIPKTWVTNTSMRCDVMLLWQQVDDSGLLKSLPINRGVDDVRYTPGAVIWRIDRVNAGRSRLTKLVGTPLYKQMTIRNTNTIRKLDQLLSA